jgi:4-amino-4-deoxy-L-arabinose transferase
MRWILILLLLVYALFGGGLRGLWKPDEGRYTCVALNMLDSGNWMLPELNEETPHFTKPPLTYWALASSVKIFGRNEWALRLPGALAFIGTVLLVGLLARRFCPQHAWLAACIYATSPWTYIAADLVTTDTLLTFCETLAMFGFVEWWFRREETTASRWLLLMWCGFGLAFMVKGPPGLLPLLPALIFAGKQAGWRNIRRLFIWQGLLLFAVLGLTWYALVIEVKPELLKYFLGSEIYGRIATDQFRRNGEWYGAFVAYAPVLLGGALPWLGLAAWVWWRERKTAKVAVPQNSLLLWWFFFMLIVFCLVRSRLPLYVLPLFVPLTLLMTQAIVRIPQFQGARLRWLLGIWALVMVVIRMGGGFIPNEKDTRMLARNIQKQVQTPIREVIFVDDSPDFGLRLYLNVEVERVNFESKESKVETLEQELACNESDQLFIVRAKEKNELLATTPPAGKTWKQVGQCGKNSLMYMLD